MFTVMFNAILVVLTENKIFKRNNEWKRQREKKPGKKVFTLACYAAKSK